MTCDVIVVLLVCSNIIHASGSVHRSDLGTNQYFDKETATSRKVKRWVSGLQDIAVDYPELDDYGDNQIDVARPFGTSPGSVLFYRPGSRRPSGAVTRTVFNPPSGFIPRVFAAAKAAIATLTGPQTVLSRTTYLTPPRPGITALQVPQTSQVVGAEGGTSGMSATNAAAAAAAAAAAVAAVTRSIYEAAGQRGGGYYEKERYPPPTTYNNYGPWPEPSRSPWTTLQPPDVMIRIPYDAWGDRARPQVTDTYGPPPTTWFKQNHNPAVTIDASHHPWSENQYNRVSYNQDGWNDYTNRWGGYDRNQGSWVQNRIKDVWANEKHMRNSYARGSGGNGGYAGATADTPPNGETYADAKITANGASAVAAAVWDLSGVKGMDIGSNKRMKTEHVYGPSEDELEKHSGSGSKVDSAPKGESEDDRFPGRISDIDLGVKTPQSKCSNEWACSLPKSNVERLRQLFPSRRKL